MGSSTGHRCALAAGEGCPAAEVADVVVHALRPSDARNLEALRALRRRRPATPVMVEVPAAVVQDRAADLAGCTVLRTPVRQGDLLDAVRQAVAPRA